MIDDQKATLPKDPNDPWQKFSDAYDALPLREKPEGRVKTVEAHSSFLRKGVIISSTFTETEEVGRVSFDTTDRRFLSPELIAVLTSRGWEFLRQGNDRLVFRKSLELENGRSSMANALPLILQSLGVEPNQDWGQ
jgi:hypothetical protein